MEHAGGTGACETSSEWETTDDDAVDEMPGQADEGELDKIPRKMEQDINAIGTAKRRMRRSRRLMQKGSPEYCQKVHTTQK